MNKKLKKTDLLQGTLDMPVLKALALGPMHGLGVSNRIAQITQGVFQVKPGSLFPALHRMEEAHVAHFLLGRIGEQPPGQVLPPDQSRTAPTQNRN